VAVVAVMVVVVLGVKGWSSPGTQVPAITRSISQWSNTTPSRRHQQRPQRQPRGGDAHLDARCCSALAVVLFMAAEA
jgi:hypothetical protein